MFPDDEENQVPEPDAFPDIVRTPPHVTTAAGASPLIPSAPSDAEKVTSDEGPVTSRIPAVPVHPDAAANALVYQRSISTPLQSADEAALAAVPMIPRRRPVQPNTTAVQGISFGAPRPTVGFTPENVLGDGSGVVRRFRPAPRANVTDATNGTSAAADRAAKLQARENALLAREQTAEVNSRRLEVLKQRGIKHYQDPATGLVVPERDQEGKLTYTEDVGPVEYDAQGRAIQTRRDETGAVAVKVLDEKAKIGTHPDTPNALYKQNKNAGWDYLGTVDEGLASKDPAIKGAAEKARLKLDKSLHSAGSEALGLNVYNAAEALKTQLGEVRTKSERMVELNRQIQAIPDEKLQERTGGFLGTQIGAQPTQEATALQAQKATLETELEALRAKGYTGTPKVDMAKLKPAKQAVTAARSEHAAWGGVPTSKPGELETILQQRRKTLEESGGDPATDPVIAAVEKQKTALGLPTTAETEAAIASAKAQVESDAKVRAASDLANGLATNPEKAVDHLTNAVRAGAIDPQAAPAAMAAAHDAADAKKKADALQKTNPTLADQFRALGLQLLSGLGTGLAELVKSPIGQGVIAANPLSVASALTGHGTPEELAKRAAAGIVAGNPKVEERLKDTVGGKIGNFAGGVVPYVAANLISGPAAPVIDASLFFSSGYQSTYDDAKAHGASEDVAHATGLTNGAVNAALALPLKVVGKAVRAVFGETAPKVITAAITNAFAKGGPEAVGELLGKLSNAIKAGGEGSAEMRRDSIAGIQDVMAEIRKPAAQRIADVGKTAAAHAAVGAGVQTVQNLVSQTYDPTRGTFEGVPEQAIGFGVLAGMSKGFEQVALARKAKQALDLIANAKPGEGAAPAQVPGLGGPAPTKPTAGMAHAEIDGLQASEHVAPEQVGPTQEALRGLVKIGTGQPIESLTAAERAAVTAKHDVDGLPRVEMVKGPDGSKPVITQAALDRVEQVAPTVRALLPQDEESQRAAVLTAKGSQGQNVPHGESQSADKIGVLDVRDKTASQGGQILPEVSREAHPKVAENSPTNTGATPKEQRSELRARVSQQGQDQTPAVPSVSVAKGGNAPPGLQPSAGGGVAVPNVPPSVAPRQRFAVEVQRPNGSVETVEVEAANAKAAHTQVAESIPAGKGLIRGVEQTSTPSREGVRVSREGVANFVDSAVAQVRGEAGRELKPPEEKRVRELAGMVAPHYDRWSKAFAVSKVTLRSMRSQGGGGGAGYSPSEKTLTVSLPDLTRHLPLFKGEPEHAANIMSEEAIHSVSTALEDRDPTTHEARGPIDLVKVFKALPEKARAAMKGAYKAGDDDYKQAHEFWRMFMQGQLELARGGKIKLKGKFLQEQSSRNFVVENRRALGTLMRYFRNMEGELRRQKTGEDVISEVGRAITLLRAKVKEVDAHAAPASEEKADGSDAKQVATAVGESGARGPPEPKGSAGAAGGALETGGGARGPGAITTAGEVASGKAGSDTGAQLNEANIERRTQNVERPTEAGSKLDANHPNQEQVSALKRNLGTEEKAIGHKSRITQNGRSVEVAYVAQDASAARPSHDIQGRATPGYDQSLQPRDRSLAQYRKQSQNIANDLDFAQAAFFPETDTPATTADLGAPVMTLGGDTLIGNGREIGIKAAYDQASPAARKYKRDFVRHAAKFGIDPKAVMAIPAPILKRVIISEHSKEELVRFSQESNAGAAMATNALETAASDATRITPGLLSLFDPNYALDSQRNADFVKAYVRDVVQGGSSASTITGRSTSVNEANLTKSDLTRRIRAAIFAHAYGMDETGRAAIERMAGDEADAGGKTITGGLLTVAPLVARLRSDIASGEVVAGMDIAPAITRAAQDISNALENKPANLPARAALEGLVNQGSLFATDPLDRAVLEFLVSHRTKRTEIEQAISNYVGGVYAIGNPKQEELSLGGGAPKASTALEVWQNATTSKALDREPERTLAAQAINNALNAETGAPPPEELKDLFAEYAAALPAAAKASHPALRRQIQNDLPGLMSDEVAFGEIFALAQPKAAKIESGNQETREDKLKRLHRQADLLSRSGEVPSHSLELARVNQEIAKLEGSGEQAPLIGEDAAVPTLRPGEKQGDLLSKQTEDLTLVGEKGTDFAKQSEDQAATEAATAEAQRVQDEQQAQIPLGDTEVAPLADTDTARESNSVIADFGEKIGGARKDLAEKTGPKIAKATDGRPGWLKKYHVFEDANKPGVWAIGLSDGGIATRQTFSGKSEAEKMVPLIEVARNHAVRSERTTVGQPESFAIQRELGPRKRPTVKGGFATREEAMRYMAEHPEEIINHKFAFPEKPWLDRIERIGPAYRPATTSKLGDVTPAQFQSAFGFRGGEFGNWNMGSDGQAALNHAYDALCDLAGALGVPPRALSLNGDLAIAFGARGQGLQGARAHYERDYAVINLTKIRGAGSAAHEWFHAFDHYLARQDTKASSEKTDDGRLKAASNKAADYVSHGFGYRSKVRAELRDAFKAVMDAMVRKNVTGEIDQTLAQKQDARMAEHVRGTLDDIGRSLTQSFQYTRKGKPPTADQLTRFDSIAAKIAAGEVGEKVFIAGQRAMSGRQSYQAIEDLNAIYKEASGRSFSTNADHSLGKQLYWQINSMRDARERLAKASEGVTEVKARPTDYFRESRNIDNFRASDYWSTPHEMGARSFEAFVHDKLAAKGRRSDYLAHGVENKFYTMLGLKPYPDGAEREFLDAAWQKVFDVVQQRETGHGVELYAQPIDPNQLPLDFEAAAADAEKTIAARFQEARPLALKIAGNYANVPGVEINDVQQHALLALARAAKAFDGSRGIPFAGLARVSVNNELRTMYRGQMRRAGKEDTSLDEKVNAEGESRKDQISDATTDVSGDVQRAEAFQMLHEAIGKLDSDRMRGALTGILNGESLEAIGERLGGISRQAVGRLATEAMRRVRGKLGEKGIADTSDLLAQAITPKGENDTEYSKSSTQVTLAPADAKMITDFAKTIPEEDLYKGESGTDSFGPKYGREDEPHVTVLYGITQSDPKASAKAIIDAGLSNVGLRLGKLSIFKNENYDVLKAEIESPDLHALNKALRDSVPFESDFPDYSPHMTIAYLKPGLGKKYVGQAPFTGRELHFGEVEFRGKDGRIHGLEVQTPVARLVNEMATFVESALKAQETDDPIAQLMAMLDLEAFDALHERAAQEESGKFTVGRPDLAMGAEDAVQRATDQHYTDTFKTKTREEMEREADDLLSKHGSQYGDVIAQRWLNGDTLRDSEVIAAKRFMASGLSADTPEAVLHRFAVGYAYRNIRGQAARDLAAGFDPHKTPEERNREFLTKTIGTLSPAQEKKISAEPDSKNRRVMLDAALRAKVRELEKATGASLEEILSGGYELHGKGSKIIEGQMLAYDVREQHALKLAQTGTRTAAEIAKMSGVGEKRVREIVDEFLADLEADLTAKVAAGLTLEKMDMSDALFAQETGAVSPSGKTPEQIKAEVARIIKGMGFVPSAELGKYKVAKKKRPTIYRPPAVPYTGKVPDETPVPFEERTQNQIPFTPEQQFRNVNPPPGGPQEPVTGPTGKILGQMGLPLYREMMIRKGADLGNIDDSVRLARIAQAINGNAFDRLYEAWINGILSAPTTHLANVTGNLANSALDFSLQRGMEALINLAYKDSKSAQFGEFKYLVKGITPGFARAISQATRSWNAEADFFANDVLNEQVSLFEDFDKGGGARPSIPGKVGRVVRMPGRALMAEDAMFKGLLGQMEVGAQAYRIAKAEGLDGDKLEARINELAATPNSLAWQRAVAKTTVNLFQEKSAIGEIMGGIKAKKDSENIGVQTLARLFAYFFPFNNTPANIFKIGVRKSPLGSVGMIARFAQAGFYKIRDGKPILESYPPELQVPHIAEQMIALIGVLAMAAVWSLVEGDAGDDKKPFLITGSMPFTQVKRGVRDLQNRDTGGTYQIRIGGRNGTYFNYGRIEPFATVIGTVADMIKSVKRMKNGETKSEAMDALAGYFLAQAQSKTWLNGFANLTKVAADADTSSEFLRKSFLQGIVPNLIRSPLRNLDPYVRDSKTAGALYEMLPVGGLAQPKIDPYGNKIEKGGNPFSRLFFAAGLKPSPTFEKADQLLRSWNRRHPQETWAPQDPVATYMDANGKNQRMTPEQKTKFLIRAGKDAATALRNLGLTTGQIERPTPDDLKRVKDAFEQAHAQVKREMFPKGLPGNRTTNVIRDFLARAA